MAAVMSILSFWPHCYRRRLHLRSSRVHASVRGQRDGCQHDAGSMQFRCAHLIGVLDVDRQQSSPRHHRNHVPGGPRRPAVRQVTAGNAFFQAARGTAVSDRKSVSSTHIRCTITLIRRAKATMARFAPRRRATSCGPCSQPCRTPAMHHHGRRLDTARGAS